MRGGAGRGGARPAPGRRLFLHRPRRRVGRDREDLPEDLRRPGNAAEYLDFEDVVAMYDEEAAVVSLITARKRKGPETRARLTRLYARWDGRWRAVMSQTTPVAPGEDTSR